MTVSGLNPFIQKKVGDQKGAASSLGRHETSCTWDEFHIRFPSARGKTIGVDTFAYLYKGVMHRPLEAGVQVNTTKHLLASLKAGDILAVNGFTPLYVLGWTRRLSTQREPNLVLTLVTS